MLRRRFTWSSRTHSMYAEDSLAKLAADRLNIEEDNHLSDSGMSACMEYIELIVQRFHAAGWTAGMELTFLMERVFHCLAMMFQQEWYPVYKKEFITTSAKSYFFGACSTSWNRCGKVCQWTVRYALIQWCLISANNCWLKPISMNCDPWHCNPVIFQPCKSMQQLVWPWSILLTSLVVPVWFAVDFQHRYM